MKKLLQNRTFQRVAVPVGLAGSSVLLATAPSWADGTPSTPADVTNGAATSLGTDLLEVPAGAATAGIVIVGVRKGWGLMKRFF